MPSRGEHRSTHSPRRRFPKARRSAPVRLASPASTSSGFSLGRRRSHRYPGATAFAVSPRDPSTLSNKAGTVAGSTRSAYPLPANECNRNPQVLLNARQKTGETLETTCRHCGTRRRVMAQLARHRKANRSSSSGTSVLQTWHRSNAVPSRLPAMSIGRGPMRTTHSRSTATNLVPHEVQAIW